MQKLRQMARGQTKPFRAHNSAVECHLHTVEVVGSNPAVPTNQINNLEKVPAIVSWAPLLLQMHTRSFPGWTLWSIEFAKACQAQLDSLRFPRAALVRAG
jgi:hypothetical protein